MTNRPNTLSSTCLGPIIINRKPGAAQCSCCKKWKPNSIANFSDEQLKNKAKERKCNQCLNKK